MATDIRTKIDAAEMDAATAYLPNAQQTNIAAIVVAIETRACGPVVMVYTRQRFKHGVGVGFFWRLAIAHAVD